MFVTHNRAEITIVAGLYEDSRTWRHIRWPLNVPWFLVTFVVEDKEGLWGETMMLYLPNDIADFIEQNGACIKSMDVQLVSPPHMNHTERWIMEPLAEIASGVLPDTGNKVVLFKCQEGPTYVDDDIHECTPKLRGKKIIYRHRPL